MLHKFFGTLALILIFVSNAHADPVTYLFQGIGTGSLNQQTFTQRQFTIVLTADTVGIVQVEPGLYDVDGPSTIEIAGFPKSTFTIATRVFSNLESHAIGFSRSRSLEGGADLLDIFNPQLTTYKLETNCGPLFGPASALSQFRNVATDHGVVTLTSTTGNVSFSATVPEPLSALITMVALGTLTMRRPRRT